eukprot:CAMPEP_0170563990 /NCGR_PEP_ID=MMETSP0211-20121228/70222_1 /TAXON_ID=311385 /ORGANISM="Pseudokeronopsis sp., Strain OXSARD2" /LENGTH=48 /DNA_ID= /DNA_START= /DNA_END= /DNA_ORIENTATION=
MFLTAQIAFQIREAIKQATGYNASAGISHNKTLAKLGSAHNKPDGQTV